MYHIVSFVHIFRFLYKNRQRRLNVFKLHLNKYYFGDIPNVFNPLYPPTDSFFLFSNLETNFLNFSFLLLLFFSRSIIFIHCFLCFKKQDVYCLI